MIRSLIQAGVDVFRLNMSHGDHSSHSEVVERIRTASAELGKTVGILCDLSGPKIRIGMIAEGTVHLEPGASFIISTQPDLPGSAEIVSCNYAGLCQDVQPGQEVLLDDGRLWLEVRAVRPPEVHCIVIKGGALSSKKGINLPKTRLAISALTEKDRVDMEFGIAQKVDFFALSFVKRVQDLEECRYFMKFRGADIPIFAKIEKREAVDNLEAILGVSEGIMVARGDLGVEIPLEEVPIIQKRIIALCNREGKPVITATQMLESMIKNFRPTRAEAADVANAILDGTDAIMLSAETAAGDYPLDAVQVMSRIAMATESEIVPRLGQLSTPANIPQALSLAAATLANQIGAAAILCLTQGGSTARRVAQWRPRCRILAWCPVPETARQLAITWGVRAVYREDAPDVDRERAEGIEAQINKAIRDLQAKRIITAGDRVVVAAGVPLHERGTTNLLRVIEVDR
jgi:pyruvate kinase